MKDVYFWFSKADYSFIFHDNRMFRSSGRFDHSKEGWNR
jgi:hypothetical protein